MQPIFALVLTLVTGQGVAVEMVSEPKYTLVECFKAGSAVVDPKGRLESTSFRCVQEDEL